MRTFTILVLFALLLSACAQVKKVQHRVLNSQITKIVEPGLKADKLEEKAGAPIHQYQLSGKDFRFYDSGFVIVENGKVTEVQNYEVELEKGQSFEDYLEKGTEAKEVFKRLAYPQEVITRGSQTYLRYNHGAVFLQNGKVSQTVDKRYEDDTVYLVQLSSFSDNSVKPESRYFIAPGSPNISPYDLLFRELRAYITESLRQQGKIVVETVNEADYIVLANFGISDPQVDVELISRPVYIPTYRPGGQVTSTYGGQITETRKSVNFNRWLNIEAIDYHHWKLTQELVPAWKILTYSVGPTGDIRLVLPALAMGILDYTNRDSSKEITLKAVPERLNEYVYETKFFSRSPRPKFRDVL